VAVLLDGFDFPHSIPVDCRHAKRVSGWLSDMNSWCSTHSQNIQLGPIGTHAPGKYARENDEDQA